MKSLIVCKEHQKGFGEGDCALKGTKIVNFYDEYFEFVFILKSLFKEQGKVDYETVTTLEEAILDA